MNELHLGTLAHVTANPFEAGGQGLEIREGGGLLIDEQGRIQALGEGRELRNTHPDARIVDHGDAWLLPGFIDGHIHFPQLYTTAAYGKDLLDWLERSIFPAEQRLRDPLKAGQAADAFVTRLLAHGTTTAMVFGSQFHHANIALFDAAKEHGLRLFNGATLMDRFGPESLLTNGQKAYDEAKACMAHIAEEPLLGYAVTPRFALSCSTELMEVCGALLQEEPNAYLQTHINESRREIETVAHHFPEAKHYLEVYERAGLLHPRSVLAHNIHPEDDELALLAERGCSVCHCPDSNLFLGSGLFPLQRHLAHRVPVFLGSDVGAGTSFSIAGQLRGVYQIQQLQSVSLGPGELLYLATLAGAMALHRESETGNFAVGKSADLVVLACDEDDYLRERLTHCAGLEEQLFVWLLLANERHVKHTMVAGRMAYTRA